LNKFSFKIKHLKMIFGLKRNRKSKRIIRQR
jgi:hypothetical protein